jgi:hypothetical protein
LFDVESEEVEGAASPPSFDVESEQVEGDEVPPISSRPGHALSDTLRLVSSGTKELIEVGANRFLDEVPALRQLGLVVRLDLRSRRDSQTWRVEFPGAVATKDPARDAKVALVMPRSHFNELARDGLLQHWKDAYENGYVRATGPEEILKLIGRVIERHETRAKVKKRRA